MTKTAESVLQDARKNNEPVLILRAKDLCALRAISEYIRVCTLQNCDKSHIDGVIAIENDFINFKNKNPNKMKIPD